LPFPQGEVFPQDQPDLAEERHFGNCSGGASCQTLQQQLQKKFSLLFLPRTAGVVIARRREIKVFPIIHKASKK
jgi:hypothetical protein